MFEKTVFLLLIFYFSIRTVQSDMGSKDPDNYGPYMADWNNYEQCRGPKARDIAENTIEIRKNADQDFISTMTITFFEQARISEVKIAVYLIKENKKSVLWSYRVDKPCQHYTIADTVEKYLNATNCVVKKGTYKFTLNTSEYTKKFFGDKFFYGEFLLRVYALSAKGNLFCAIYKPVFYKKK